MSDHETLRCITVRLPWAAAIMAGVKTVENRTRSTSYRGPVGIHAAAPSGWSVAGAMDPRIRAWWGGPAHARDVSTYGMSSMFRGILAVADLVDCHTESGCCEPWGDPGVKHLVLANIRPLYPVVARGSLAVPWTAPADVARAVWDQIEALEARDE